MSDEQWTVGRLLTWTTDYLKQRDADSPRLDAEVLLAHVYGCSRIELYSNYLEVASEEMRTRFRELIKKRAEGMPVAYIVGKREFYSLDFKVTPAVLIPRPETELVVVTMIDIINSRKLAAAQVCDMCTGSGCIAVTVATRVPTARLTAVDISPEALAVARENAATHGVADRVTFVESDLFAAIPPGQMFDLISANPPYISTADCETLPSTVRDYEPQLALDAGEHGMDIAERLIPQAAEHLQPGGMLAMEISVRILDEVSDLMTRQSLFNQISLFDDLQHLPRVIVGVRV